MKRIVKKMLLNLIFFILIVKIIQPNQQSLYLQLHQLRTEQDVSFNISDEDEKLLQELWSVTSDFYKKIIETTVLYFSGILISADQFHKQLLLETSKHMIYASQIIAKYLPQLLQNPKISWKIKAKRCVYLSGLLIMIIIAMQEYRQTYINNMQNLMRTNIDTTTANNSLLYLHNSQNLEPRQRPTLSA